MKHRIQLAVAILVGLLVPACSGPAMNAKKVGEEALKAGEFEKAEAHFLKMVEANEEDQEAKLGVERVRYGWMVASMKAVINLIDAGRHSAGIEGLEDVIRKERSWKLEPMGQLAVMQLHAVDWASGWVRQRFDEFMEKRRPLAAREFINAHRDAFGDEIRGKRALERLDADLASAGAAHCEDFWSRATVNTPNFAEFTARYCALWGHQKTVPVELYGALDDFRSQAVNLSGRVVGATSAEMAVLETALRGALEKSPMFSATGRNRMLVKTSGGVIVNRRDQPEKIIHKYGMEIPYTVMEDYCEWKIVKEKVRKQVDGVDRWVEDEKSVCEKRTRPVMKYRMEGREMAVPAIRHHQRLSLEMEVVAVIDGVETRVPVNRELVEDDLAHDVSNPALGLSPDPVNLTDRNDWIAKQFNEIGTTLREHLQSKWDGRFCRDPADDSFAGMAEQALGCVAGHPAVRPMFIDTWFGQQFGMTMDEVEALLLGQTVR